MAIGANFPELNIIAFQIQILFILQRAVISWRESNLGFLFVLVRGRRRKAADRAGLALGLRQLLRRQPRRHLLMLSVKILYFGRMLLVHHII